MSDRELTSHPTRETGHPIVTLQREMDRIFSDVFRDFDFPRFRMERPFGAPLMPSVDVSETDTALEVEVELPGLDEHDIEVNLGDGRLTIKGEKKQEKEEKKKDFHRSERSYGRIERVIALPAEVQEDKVTARFSKGVLTVTLPKASSAKSKVKKITVSGR